MPRTSRFSDRQTEIVFGLGLLIPVALLLILAEGAARLYTLDRREAGRNWDALIAAVGIDEGTYVRFRPNSQAGHLAFNDQGFRGPTLPVPAPEGTVRIAFLGDSKIFSAELPLAATLPAQTVALLEKARPHCHFDYVAIAGPGYDMDTLATLWVTHAPMLEPNLAVILAGPITDLIARHDATVHPEDRIIRSQDRGSPTASGSETPARGDLARWSTLLRLVQRNLALASPTARVTASSNLSWDVLAASYQNMAAKLVRATSGVPTLAIGYRSRLGADQDAADYVENSRHLRSQIPGLSVETAMAFSEFVPEQLENVAADVGWIFLDPIRTIPADDAFFIDPTHFSEAGLAKLAEPIAAQIALMVNEACEL